jgi:alpha-tubulin suppressor-like RCC1 family protein
MDMSRWIQPARIQLYGDTAKAQQLLGVARQQIGVTRNLMGFQSLKQLVRKVDLGDGIEMRVGVIHGQAFAEIYVPVVLPVSIPEIVIEPGEGSVPKTAAGGLYTWGNNMYGQLGTGDNDGRFEPTLIDAENVYTQVVCGQYHTLALREDGSLWSFGYNLYGELGVGDNTSRTEMTRVGTEEDVWIYCSAGGNHSFGIKEDGSLWSWGRNYHGQLGLGDRMNRNTPQAVTVSGSTEFSQVAAGETHTVALGKWNAVMYASGRNNFGQIGQRTHSWSSYYTTFVSVRGNTTDDPLHDRFQFVEAGVDFSLGIRLDDANTGRNGEVRTCGRNANCELGTSCSLWSERNYLVTPPGAGTGNKIAAAGRNHALVAKKDEDSNELVVWGLNTNGQLGYGHTTSPVYASRQGTEDWLLLASGSAGGFHSLAIKRDTATPEDDEKGFLYVWGGNGQGTLGTGDTEDILVPTKLEFQNLKWSCVGAGRFHSAGFASQ